MDINAFLKRKTDFIHFFYKEARQPFDKIKHLIENEKEPFVPPYSEDGEPSFIGEWIQADESIDVLGHTAISMLSVSLKLFLEKWAERLEGQTGYAYNKSVFKKGWFPGYLKIIEDIGFPVDTINTDVLEQISLARNRIQHPESITTNAVTHSNTDVQKYPEPFFSEKSDLDFFFSPTVKITSTKVETAVKLVEEFCAHIEEEFSKNSISLRAKYK